MRFKVGQKVVVKDCVSGGNFENGDIVEIVQIGTDDGDDMECYGAISPWDGMLWYLYEDEVGPVTNADKILSMTDEELAKFLSHYLDCENCELSYIEDIWGETRCKGKHNECWKNVLEWLKQPVKGE